MIQVTVESHKKRLKSLVVTGHAQSADQGQDLVCAGVSCIVFGGCNAIDTLKCGRYHKLTDLIEIVSGNEKGSDILTVLLIQLQTVAEEYPHYVQITYKEVQ
ncbi:MAG: ribosomal-processing cysteine protease Prp [Erysipelotrichaceae bacterium]|nr:ribosomal-processing cysteine protease Prp [Erysipelotrichaceae bacterium]